MGYQKGFSFHLLLVAFVLLPVLTIAQGIEIESGTSITMSGAASIEIEDGGFINDGTYIGDADTVTFSGTSADTISGSSATDFYILNNSNSGGMLIDSSAAVSVSNSFTNTGIFSIDSDASGSGSFIVSGSSTGNINYYRYMTGVDEWHFIASPLTGQDIEEFAVTNVATNAVATNDIRYGLAPYDEGTQGWDHFSTSAGGNDIASAGNFTAGKGYEVLRTSAGKVTFTGTINTSDVSIGITSSGNSWNLVGNPYTAAINANANADAINNLLTTNLSELNASFGAIYLWDAASSSYSTVNQTSGATYIAPGQAFFVRSVDGGATVSITEAMQTHQTSSTLLKSAALPNPSIKLLAEYNGEISSTKILYLDNTTTGLDPGYDAGRFSAGNNSFAVYTHLVGDSENNVAFDIQCLPSDDFTHVVPVGLNASKDLEVIFRIQTENLPAEIPVFLEDNVTGTYIDLRKTGSSYTATVTDQTNGFGRFYLYTKSGPTEVNSLLNPANLIILPHQNSNSIRIIGKTSNKARVVILDISGRQLVNSRLKDSEINDVDMNGLKNGVYIVTIRSSMQQTSKKIIWINAD